MAPELGPPDVEVLDWSDEDRSWVEQWRHFRDVLATGSPLLGGVEDARFAWDVIERAYQDCGYGAVREAAVGIPDA